MPKTIIKDQLKVVNYPSYPLEVPVEITFYNGEVWLTQKDIAKLYGVQRLTIKKHLRNAYKKSKLIEPQVTAHAKETADSEQLGGTTYYNLEAILNIGHRINSALPIMFERWLEARSK